MLELVDKSTKDPLVGQSVEIHSVSAKAVNVWRVTGKAIPKGMKPFEIQFDAFPEHIRMFKEAGMKIEDGKPFDCSTAPYIGEIGLYGNERRIVAMVSDFGGMVRLEDSDARHKAEIEKARSIPAIASTETPAQETVTIAYNFTGELPDTLPELLALLEEISKKLFKMWEKEPAPDKRQARDFGNINMKRVALSRIFQEIDMLIRMMHVRGELKRKKD